jgi:hypothetical protein
MIAELELPLFKPPTTDPNVDWLSSLLLAKRGWLTAAEIIAASGSELNDRAVRALASLASPDVISGQRGYRHIQHATAEEINHAAAWLESQGAAMIDRACAIRRRAHQLVG